MSTSRVKLIIVHCDGWLRDGSAAYVESLCDYQA